MTLRANANDVGTWPGSEVLLSLVKVGYRISSSGNTRTTTVRGYTPDEFTKLAAEAPTP